ncbi:uncharacterized protein PHALS_11768 [Plasmopara halstedii]|uniref:WRKY19-like zinc finger domain-containing protein n=1 Tax=Plasmopara halstedii TaxID=4781 RepID=A0A0N7L5G6_PLAHL|nr:uncharacterized protein PHALS_11768 [Plasmopara halstedii]CEG41419.1 hypothetical protein PHALS_11768 [Plasmopara halstedii]|eukprot:XP_024577788.1 hypothetical protein PHALS_11768 [Plasmopara halstedii]
MRTLSFHGLFIEAGVPSSTSLLSPNATFDALGTYADTDTTPKGSIDFILGDAAQTSMIVSSKGKSERDNSSTVSKHNLTMLSDAATPKRKKRKARICKEIDCDKYVVDHGLCIRHGGGKRCSIEECNSRAQNRGLCWKHGGYTICTVEACTKRAKSRGICWSHGGGTRCKEEGCVKIAVSLGRCWAHGGGKRCSVEICRKPASERTNNFCTDHFAWYRQVKEAKSTVTSS